jgi:hypothetical protein
MSEAGGGQSAEFQASLRNEGELALLAERLAVIGTKARQSADRSRPRETIPALFGRAYDENFISDYLAYILDPARNGIGSEPLQALLSVAFDPDLDVDLDNVTILREYAFGDVNFGRIDLLIQLGDQGERGVIGIENKILASEGDTQTISYATAFDDDFPNKEHYLIFLTPDGYSPMSEKFKAVSYAQLCWALREIRYPVLNDIHKGVIWEDFLTHVEEYIAMTEGKLELSGKTRLYLEHRQVLESLNKAFAEDSKKVYDYVTAGIRISFGEGWTFNFQGRNPFQEIQRADWKIGDFYVFFQYRFSRDSLLIQDQFACMLGAYPVKHAKGFVEWLRADTPQIAEYCQSLDMDAYPNKPEEKHSALIAHKIFPLDNEDIARMKEQFVRAAEEFSAFTPMIDEAVHRYKQLLSSSS